MTRVINHRKKKQQLSNPIFSQMCKTEVEVEIKQRNITKLLFVQSDDGNSEQQREQETLRQISQSARIRKNTNDLDLHRQRPFNKEFKVESKMLKPSLMKGLTDNQDDYEQIINCEDFKPPPRAVQNKTKMISTIQQNSLFQELVGRRDRMRNSKLQRKQLPKPFFDEKVKKNNEKVQKKQPKKQEQSIIIPKLQIANMCFEMSDQQPQQADEAKKRSVSEATTSKQLATPMVQKDEDGFQTLAEQSSLRCSQQSQQPDLTVDITQNTVNKQISERSKYLYEAHKNHKLNENQIVGLMITPILQCTKQVFQLQVFSGITQKVFTFWLDMGQEIRLLMRANKLPRLNKTVYEFQTFDEKSKHYIQTCTLASNVDRSMYDMFQFQRKTSKKRVLATYSQIYNIKNNKLIVIYYPKVKLNNQTAIFYDSQESTSNLQAVFRENKIHQVDYAMTTNMDIGSKLKVMDFYNLRASQKSMEFKHRSGSMQVIIGKKQSKRYKIIAGPGLSPVQIFGLAIVQIQT